MKYTETIVMSVGGSLIVPDEIDTVFLKNLHEFINKHIEDGKRIIVIAGGGKTARKYQEAAKAVTSVSQEDLDWIGLHSTRLNGYLLINIFSEKAYKELITNPDKINEVPEDSPLVIAAGYRPGASTDLRAIQIAENCGAKRVINLSDIDYVYNENPKDNPDAEKIENITWYDFIELIPSEWKPGLSSPFDPIAARRAKESNVEVAIINGNKLEELDKYLYDDKFIGTKIS